MPTAAELKAKHEQQVDQNRTIGVIPWKNGEAQSDRVYEVIDGYVTLPGATKDGGPLRIGPGQRFHPTERQVRQGSFRNKARELTQTEYGTVQRTERKPMSTGADFDAMRVRALDSIGMADGTRKLAVEAGLEFDDFKGVEPANGDQYTRAQVQELIDAKNGADSEE